MKKNKKDSEIVERLRILHATFLSLGRKNPMFLHFRVPEWRREAEEGKREKKIKRKEENSQVSVTKSDTIFSDFEDGYSQTN